MSSTCPMKVIHHHHISISCISFRFRQVGWILNARATGRHRLGVKSVNIRKFPNLSLAYYLRQEPLASHFLNEAVKLISKYIYFDLYWYIREWQIFSSSAVNGVRLSTISWYRFFCLFFISFIQGGNPGSARRWQELKVKVKVKDWKCRGSKERRKWSEFKKSKDSYWRFI